MQVNTSFQRPIGATRDVAELEYISALAQTAKRTVRPDGSLRDADIRLFLSSRYGIRSSEEEVRATVLRGLTTTTAATNSGVEGREHVDLDLMEVVSLLFVPLLLKAAAAADAGKKDVVADVPENNGTDAVEAAEKDGGDTACPENVQLPPPNILSDVLRMILEDVTGDSVPKPLTPGLIQRMLRSYGEIELSEDEQLIREMVDAALPLAEEKDVEEGERVLDAKSFAAALTHDVQSYDISKERSTTTRFADVFSTKVDPGDDDDDDDDDDEIGEEQEKKKVTDKKDLNRVYTCPAIDSTVGTYRSAHLLIALWVTALVSYFAYFFSFSTSAVECDRSFVYSLTTPWKNNADKMGCQVGASIANWFFFFLALSVYGWVFVGFGSIGNSAGCRRWYLPLLGLCVVLFISLWPFALVDTFNKSEYLSSTAFTIAMVTCAFHLSASLGMLLPSTLLDKCDRLKAWFSGSAGRAEMRIKSAAAHKLNLMARNALVITGEAQSGEIHSSNFHQAVTNYTTRDVEYEEVGGFLWAWKHLFNRKIYDEEGVWYSVRLLAANVTQYIVACIIIYLGSVFAQQAAEAYETNASQSYRLSKVVGKIFDRTISQERVDKMVLSIADIIATFTNRLIDLLSQVEGIVVSFDCEAWADRLDAFCDNTRLVDCSPNITLETLICGLTNSTLDGFERLDLLNASGLDANQLIDTAKENLQQSIDDTTESLFPTEKYMVTVPVIVGFALAFCLSLFLALGYLPSITSTILKARCGIIKSLHDKDFNEYRTCPDLVALITGAVFWGNLFASLTFGGVVGLVIFIFVWQATVYFAIIMASMLIGVTITFLIRYAIVLTVRCSFWHAFYRTNPAAANVILLGLEWANFALSSLFIFIRLVKFLLAAALSVGRIDYPFLAKESSKLGPWVVDRYPDIHFQDLLSHEAHRHPYIELLGTMYLMKLRHGPNFGKRSGSCWRLLFVYALMPWLSKYRALTRPESRQLLQK